MQSMRKCMPYRNAHAIFMRQRVQIPVVFLARGELVPGTSKDETGFTQRIESSRVTNGKAMTGLTADCILTAGKGCVAVVGYIAEHLPRLVYSTQVLTRSTHGIRRQRISRHITAWQLSIASEHGIHRSPFQDCGHSLPHRFTPNSAYAQQIRLCGAA